MLLQATGIGPLAAEALKAHWQASVTGVTSGGVFLRAADRRVVFISYSPFRSPITINLHPQDFDLQRFENGQSVTLSPGVVTFQHPEVTVRITEAKVWDPDPPNESISIEWPQIATRLRRIAIMAGQAKEEDGFAPALAALLGLSPFRPCGDLSPALVEAMVKASNLSRQGDYLGAVQAALRWVGYGRGLTPAGDDCLAGMLLVLNRWKAAIPAPSLVEINQLGIQAAGERTTLLSRSIIEAAMLGLADERILDVLDGIIEGFDNEELAVDRLVKMGHSSGVDTLVGITLILSARITIASDWI